MKAKTIALAISLVFVTVAMGFQTDPQIGTWKVNEAKSKFPGKARNHTVVYESAGDQVKVTVDGVDENGSPTHSEWTGKYDGKEICKQLKSAEHSKGIKVILHSAYPEIKNEYKLCGADEFILKPVAIDHLVSRLNYNLKK